MVVGEWFWFGLVREFFVVSTATADTAVAAELFTATTTTTSSSFLLLLCFSSAFLCFFWF